MKPTYINNTDWNLVNFICTSNPEEPYLIAAIGWHETKWGTIGAGPGGWHLGYGYYGSIPTAAKYKGLEKQLIGAHVMILVHFKFPVTLESVTDFAVNHWKSSVPTAWAKSVYNKFVMITDNSISEGNTMNANTKLTANFSYGEFFCKGIEPPQQYFNNILKCATELQKVRDIIRKPIIITSGYRSKAHNTAIGGAKYSQHLTGSAADSHAVGLDLRIYAVYLARYTNFGGFCIGSYQKNDLIHADLRDKFWVSVY